MPSPKRTYLYLVALAALLALSTAMVWQKKTSDQPDGKAAALAVPVKTAAPQRLAVADFAQAVGSFIAEKSAMVSAEIGGRVKSLHFAEGLPVKEGELLVQLEPDEYQATAAQSRAQATLDKLSLGRTGEVRRRNLASQQSLDEAEARWQQSQALAQRDQVRLEKTAIRAPFTGVAGLRLVSPGAYVTPGQPLVNLEALDNLKLDFALPEHYAGRVAPGQKITARVDAYPGEEFTGELYAVDPRLDEQTRSLKLRGRIANADRRLKPGMFVRLTLLLGADRQALFVPEHALIGIGSHQYVYLAAGNKAVKTEVAVGQHRDGMVEISSGVAADSAVVVEGQMKLRDGAAVQATPQS